jgi:hypothetical protein
MQCTLIVTVHIGFNVAAVHDQLQSCTALWRRGAGMPGSAINVVNPRFAWAVTAKCGFNLENGPVWECNTRQI